MSYSKQIEDPSECVCVHVCVLERQVDGEREILEND